MAQPVSILDGEVNRNWHVVDSQGQKHLLTLFHDCVTGARAAMLDYEVSLSTEVKLFYHRFIVLDN